MPLKTVVVSVVEGRCDAPSCGARIFPGQWFVGNGDNSITYHALCATGDLGEGWAWQLATGLPQPGSQEGNEPG